MPQNPFPTQSFGVLLPCGALTGLATKLNKTLYAVKRDLLRNYLQAESRNLQVPARLPA